MVTKFSSLIPRVAAQFHRRFVSSIPNHEPSNYKEVAEVAKVAVVVGVKSNLGRDLVDRFQVDGSFRVVGTTQGVAKSPNGNNYFEVGGVDFTDPITHDKDYWTKFFAAIEGKYGKVATVVNLVGVTHAETPEKLEAINRNAVRPMFEGAAARGIPQFTQLSSIGAGIPTTGEEVTYISSRKGAEDDLLTAAEGSKKPSLLILRSSLMVSCNNSGHMGGPQRMSGSRFKITAGIDPKKAGDVIVSPVASSDITRAILNAAKDPGMVSGIVIAEGPEAYSISNLLQKFSELRGDHSFWAEFNLPIEGLLPFVSVNPEYSLERDHLKMIAHIEKDPEISNLANYEKQKLFQSLVNSPLTTIQNEVDSVNRPVFGRHDLLGYTSRLWNKIDTKNSADLKAMAGGVARLVLESRLAAVGPYANRYDHSQNDSKHRKKAIPNSTGVNLGHLLLLAIASAAAGHISNRDRDRDENNENNEGYFSKAVVERSATSDQKSR